MIKLLLSLNLWSYNKVVLQDLGTLPYFLGIGVAHNVQEGNTHLSRGKYI